MTPGSSMGSAAVKRMTEPKRRSHCHVGGELLGRKVDGRRFRRVRGGTATNIPKFTPTGWHEIKGTSVFVDRDRERPRQPAGGLLNANVGSQLQVRKCDAKEGRLRPPKDARQKLLGTHNALSPTPFRPIEFSHQGLVLRGQPDPRSLIIDPFAVRNDPIALMWTGRVEPSRHMPGTGVGWRLESESQGRTHGRSWAPTAKFLKENHSHLRLILPSR
jgi:hypothetical protein